MKKITNSNPPAGGQMTKQKEEIPVFAVILSRAVRGAKNFLNCKLNFFSRGFFGLRLTPQQGTPANQMINGKWKMENSSNGQSLVEVVVAVALIFSAVVALLGLATASLKGTGFSNNKAKAVKMANEEMELVRAYRDSKAWGLFRKALIDDNDCSVDACYITQSGGLLNLAVDGPQNSGIFSRYIVVEDVVGVNTVKITVHVTWQAHGEENDVAVSSVFTNWR